MKQIVIVDSISEIITTYDLDDLGISPSNKEHIEENDLSDEEENLVNEHGNVR